MGPFYKSLLLFLMNWLDAQLTLLWVRLNVATEGNRVMALLLDVGDAPFLGFKMAVGAFAAYVLYRCAHVRIAQRGMWLALGVYLAVMAVHILTGFSSLGWQAPEIVLSYFGGLPKAAFSLLFS